MITEERYGRLVVLERLAGSRRRVRCDCGVEKIVRRADLTRGRTKSCGCLRRERITGHGHTRRALSKSPEWRSWQNMKQRCLNPNHVNYDHYGGRGITVVDRWLGGDGFVNFLDDMGHRPAGCSLDRIDNDRGYGPDNCRWATAVEQAANSRRRLAPALLLLREVREAVELPGELAARVAKLLGDPLPQRSRTMEASDQTQSQPDPGTDPASAPEEGAPAADPSPATSEPSPGDTEGSPSESTEPAPEESPSSDPAPAESSEPAGDEPAEAGDQAGGLLAGTGSEQEQGVGGAGDHPAPAQMRDPETGELHSAGQPPSGTVEQEQSPTGDATDRTSAGHALSDEAREELEQVHEPDQADTERPDLGTE